MKKMQFFYRWESVLLRLYLVILKFCSFLLCFYLASHSFWHLTSLHLSQGTCFCFLCLNYFTCNLPLTVPQSNRSWTPAPPVMSQVWAGPVLTVPPPGISLLPTSLPLGWLSLMATVQRVSCFQSNPPPHPSDLHCQAALSNTTPPPTVLLLSFGQTVNLKGSST